MYTVQDLHALQLFCYDPTQHEFHPTELDKSYFYVLKGNFSQREIPDPVRAAPAMNIEELQHVNLVHATSIGGVKGILQDQQIGPSRLHHSTSQSFFSLGAKRTTHKEWDKAELSRLLFTSWYASKNTSNVLVVAVGWGTAEAVKSGGEAECIRKTFESGTVHHKNGRMWVTNQNSHRVQGLAFRVEAESPLD